jgi:oligoendopeptidase F
VHTALPAFYKYVGLRSRCLGLPVLDMYDHHVPLVSEFSLEVPYSLACSWLIDALKPLGPQYAEIVKRALSQRWIDVYENRGKRSGAYSGGCYDSPSYILMNYTPDIHGAFTLAHEMGHSVHSTLSNSTQPHIYSRYRIFVAEVASTVNEGLLLSHLLSTTSDTRLRAYLLNYKCNEFRTTVYRQTMFAEFEKLLHAKAEAGDPLTPKAINDMYFQLNKLYYGPGVVADKRIELEWARIPHFFLNFYVYKYSTSFAVSEKVVKDILSGRAGAVDNYLAFLKAGRSKEPMDLLSDLGVDLRKPDAIIDALQEFGKYVDQLSDLLASP